MSPASPTNGDAVAAAGIDRHASSGSFSFSCATDEPIDDTPDTALRVDGLPGVGLLGLLLLLAAAASGARRSLLR